MVASVDAGQPAAIALLERLVNINSGTHNFAGVRAVADALAPEFQKLGFTTRWGHFNPKHIWGELRLVIAMPGKQPRRVSGGDVVRMMMSGGGDRELIWVLKEMDIL